MQTYGLDPGGDTQGLVGRRYTGAFGSMRTPARRAGIYELAGHDRLRLDDLKHTVERRLCMFGLRARKVTCNQSQHCMLCKLHYISAIQKHAGEPMCYQNIGDILI